MTQVLDAQHDTARGIGAWVAGQCGTLVVVAATLVVAMGFGGLGLITVFMGPMEAELGWSRSDTSLAYAFSTAGMAIGGLWWDGCPIAWTCGCCSRWVPPAWWDHCWRCPRSVRCRYFTSLTWSTGGWVFQCCTRLCCPQVVNGFRSDAGW